MRIAVCNRDILILEKIKNMIYLYARRLKLDLSVECFSSGEEFLLEHKKYNIVFLGYFLNGADGLEIAKKIRKENFSCFIIFISEKTDFVFEAFKVNPYRFLVLPITEKEFFCALDDFFKDFGLDYPLWIKCGEDTVCINTSEIIYLEASNKHCLINLKNEDISCNKTMAKVYDVLPKNHFIKINRAYIINLNYVSKYNRDNVFFKNGKSLHISRNYYGNFKDEYRLFLNPRQP